MSDDIRQQAEQRLAQREAKHGPVKDRERYLSAVMRGLIEEQAERPAPVAPKVDRRPDCPTCDGNGWVDAPKQGSYSFVTRCPDCDHGRVTVRAAAEPMSEAAVGRARLAAMRQALGRPKPGSDSQ